jgi:hypothetical protein
MATPAPEPGGFLSDALPSPVSVTSTTTRTNLPQPRSHPLRAGSTKEETTRRYVEGRLLQVSRLYTKKFQPAEPGDDATGYTRIRDVCRDLSEIVDVLWLSGTRESSQIFNRPGCTWSSRLTHVAATLQIPYLLNIALSLNTYLTAFPPDPVPTFALLRKLDHAFASLLLGHDIDSGHALPGFQGKRGGMTRTDMVRCKSLVEGMRVLIVEVMSKEGLTDLSDPVDTDTNEQIGTDTDIGTAYGDTESGWDDEQDYHMDVARVFEKTIIQLGESLGSSTGYDVGGG